MALSFKDSLKAQNKVLSEPESKISAVSLSYDLGSEPLAYSDESSEQYTQSDKYLWYEEYKDDDISEVDDNKNVTVNQNQINLTQEANSQFIPFKIPRYYDGVDLMRMNILVHYVTSQGYEDNSAPINASYSDSHIKFGWLVPKNATVHEGALSFEIHAIGVNSKGDEYIWKTCPNKELNVLKSLEGNGIIEPDSSWMTSFFTQINEQVAIAQTAATNAESASEQALNAANQAQSIIDAAEDKLTASVNETVSNSLSNYYTSDEVDSLLSNIDLTDVYDKIDNIDGLANFNADYDNDSKTLSFYNGTTLIKSLTLNSNPGAEWVTAYDAKVDSKITSAVTPVQTALDDYKTATDASIALIHNDIDGLPETLATDYYNRESTDTLLDDKADKTAITSLTTSISAVESTANTNKTNITVLGNKISDLESLFGDIDTSPQFTYDITYDEEQLLTLWEKLNEITYYSVLSPI